MNDQAHHDAATNRRASYLTIHTTAAEDAAIQSFIDRAQASNSGGPRYASTFASGSQ
jgi:hypothetical protein